MSTKFYSPPQIAEMFAISADKVAKWIARGELIAVNVSEGKHRPRWRVSAEALAEFQRARSNQKQQPAPRSSRRRQRRDVVQYV